jgi:hypothetical protein
VSESEPDASAAITKMAIIAIGPMAPVPAATFITVATFFPLLTLVPMTPPVVPIPIVIAETVPRHSSPSQSHTVRAWVGTEMGASAAVDNVAAAPEASA